MSAPPPPGFYTPFLRSTRKSSTSSLYCSDTCHTDLIAAHLANTHQVVQGPLGTLLSPSAFTAYKLLTLKDMKGKLKWQNMTSFHTMPNKRKITTEPQFATSFVCPPPEAYFSKPTSTVTSIVFQCSHR